MTLVALAYLLISVQRGSIKNNEQRIRLYRLVELIGRWSMVDVFVAARGSATSRGLRPETPAAA